MCAAKGRAVSGTTVLLFPLSAVISPRVKLAVTFGSRIWMGVAVALPAWRRGS